MADCPRRQEQEPAAADVTEVAPGVLRCQLPIDMPGLGLRGTGEFARRDAPTGCEYVRIG